MNDYIHDRLRSNNVQSEIVFCLSPNNNIGEAFRKFGISDESKNIVVIKVGEGDVKKEIEEHLRENLHGDEVGFTNEWFREVGDLEKVKKNYKVAKVGKGNGKVNGESGRDEWMDVEVQVLGAMALRGAT